ncbi:hypothetical protein K1L80_000732 [Vibrio fluvialis]|nr:hypothetical protein [Vibrio fluvialis]
MKLQTAVVIASLFLLSVPLKSDAKRGLGSLFKAGRGVSAINGVKSYDFNTLTFEQLRQCLELESNIELSEQSLSNGAMSLSYQEKLLSSLEADMNSLERYLKLNQNSAFYTQAEVDTFNRKVEKYNRLILVYNAELKKYRSLESPYNREINVHNAKVEQFQLECAGKRYYEDDLLAIKSGTK